MLEDSPDFRQKVNDLGENVEGLRQHIQRMVDLTKKYGAERFIVDSSCDWGVSDPLSVPKTARMMLDQGVPAEAVEQATWGNAAKAYGYSGQIDMDALGEPVVVDQRELFSDNSVLRGQPARVDDGVPN